MSKEHDIEDIEALREVIGARISGLGEKNLDHIDEPARGFIGRCPFLVLSTSDGDGRIDASPKGDAPGFVMVPDSKTLVIPDRPGNKLVYGHQNILANPHAGVLFIIPGTAETLRVNGTAALTREPGILERLSARGKPALLAIRVHVEECFFHCAKAFIRSKLWQPDTWPEKQKISFGRMYVERKGGGEALARRIDEEIEADYRDNL